MAHGTARPRIKYGACPLLMVSLMTAVYTDEPQQVQGCKGCLALVAEDLLDTNDYRGHCLHCRREITAQDGQEALPALWEGWLVTKLKPR